MKKTFEFPKWLVEMLIHWPIFSLALWLSDSFFDGIQFLSIKSIFISSLLLTVLNLFIKPILLVLALPLAILSLGLIIPFINGLFILLVAKLIDGFYVDSYLTSVLAAICISLFSVLTQIAIGKTGASVMVKGRKKTSNEADFNATTFNDNSIIDVEAKEKNKNP